jgi:hypothetical protein
MYNQAIFERVVFTQQESGEMFCALYFSKKNFFGWFSTYGGEEKCMQGFGGETWRKKSTWKT